MWKKWEETTLIIQDEAERSSTRGNQQTPQAVIDSINT
ncbi:MAG: hypothetical protein CM15mV142_510 [Caudoviricetes sp.]|nr:MAG: hypothetical protein CM15mV142_510 [Caudoviricetes sp.]